MDAMDEKKPTVDIEHSQIYGLATVLGLMTKAFEDWDASLFDAPHDRSVSALLVCVFLLDRSLQGDLFQSATGTLFDVASKRAIMANSPKKVEWPLWDNSTLKHPELAPVYDLGIALAAWNLAAKQDELPPEMFLGPLFSLAGIISEGVDHGYYLEDKTTRKAYQEQRERLAQSHGGEEEFKKALKAQLESIASTLENMK